MEHRPFVPKASLRSFHILAAILTISGVMLVLFLHPLAHGDGLAHFMYLDSIAGDGDLDLSNQASRFAAVNSYHIFRSPETGKLVTAFPFGSAYLMAPFYWIGALGDSHIAWLQANPEHFASRQGLGLAYSLTTSLGTCLYTLASVALAYATARRIAPPWAAGLAAVTCLIGTPLLFYSAIQPFDTHAYGTFLLTLALWVATRKLAPEGEAADGADRLAVGGVALTKSSALIVGLVIGWAVLVRWQLLLYAVPVGVVLLYRWLRLRCRRSFMSLATFTAGIGLFIALCIFYFWRFFGAPFLIPSEVQSHSSFVGTPLRYLPQVLFDFKRGWFIWSPIALIALLGLISLARRRPGFWSVAAAVCLGGIALEVALNASLYDWSGGWAFGQRRMSEAYSALVLGCAWVVKRARASALASTMLVLCSLYSLLLLVAHVYYTHTTSEVAGGNFNITIGWLFSAEGQPPLWLVLSERYGPWSWSAPHY